MIKVSIIVPVYNASKTLNRCLQSLVGQTLSEIEIIAVDDCSSDDSWDILQAWESKYPEKMIIIKNQKNLGAGGARNEALKYVHGEYIGFCDSDDYVHTNMYRAMYEEAVRGDYDFVDCGYLDEKEDKGYLKTGDNCTGVLNAVKRNELIAAGGYLVSHIFKRELFDGITFRENIILEDMEILMELILKAEKISSVKEIFYMYCFYENSSSRKQDPKRYYNAVINAVDAIKDKVISRADYEDVRPSVEYAVTYLLTLGTINLLDKNNGLSPDERKFMCNEIIKRRNTVIKIPINDNEYSMNKILGTDLDLLMKLNN